MASVFDNLIANATKHTVLDTSQVKAVKCGHIYNVKVSAAADNGKIVTIASNQYAGRDVFLEQAATSTSVTGRIVDIDDDGKFVVFVDTVGSVGHVAILAQDELMYPEISNNPAFFYNAANDVVRAYELVPGDKFAMTTEGFTGATPAVGKAVASAASGKLTVSA